MATTRKKRPPLSEATKAAEKRNPALKVKRIGTDRLLRALKSIALVGNLSRYKPSRAQSEYIVNQLRTATVTVEKQFAGTPEAKLQVNMPDA